MAIQSFPQPVAEPLHAAIDTSHRSASELIEWITSRPEVSSAVYVYDVAEQVGFGSLVKTAWETPIPVIPLQTRAGAGLSLVGRLSESTSQDALNGSVLTVYTTPEGLAAMAPALIHLPPASPGSKLIIQVATATPVGESFALSSTLAPLSIAFNLLPDSLSVLLSATPQEAVDLARLSYALDTHVVHIFDHHSATREVGHQLVLKPLVDAGHLLPASEALHSIGHPPFQLFGDDNAHTVLVLLNGQLALVARALSKHIEGLAVLIVKALRPWDEDTFRTVIPPTAEKVYVFDDVPNDTIQGPLFMEVFSSLYDPISPLPMIRSQRITPEQTQLFQSQPADFVDYLAVLAEYSPTALQLPTPPTSTKLLFLSTPATNLSPLYQFISDTFSKTTLVRRLTDHDVFSSKDGLTANRVVFTPKVGAQDFLALPALFPLDGSCLADFICVLDAGLLKSHAFLDNSKQGSAVLVITSRSATELVETLPPSTVALVLQRSLRIYIIDTKPIIELVSEGVTRDIAQCLVVYFVFLRLYLGKASNEPLIRKLTSGVISPVFSSEIFSKLSARSWSELTLLQLPEELPLAALEYKTDSSALKRFESNTIAVSTGDGDTVYNGSRISLWHEAAKHILFPSAFTPLLAAPPEPEEEFPQNPLLRPDLPERTYLVTCSVNRRLTPIEYDRNVFHLEFDTEGTGLKYAIGEALGVHGWNDEQEVLDFCAWYGVDPGQVITIPVPGSEGKMHTRTIFQALQQQIDLFGKPSKSFYTDVAQYATRPYDKLSLQFIGSSEGSSTFEKLSKKDTVSFADILQRYPSARPSIEMLCELIGDIKPRHYSIASSQAVVGNRVDLLIVTVEWTAPNGELVLPS